jgi:hypothetical protein
MSRAKQDGESSSAGVAGLVMGIIGLLFGIVLALTCGVCGALCTAATVMPQRDAGPNRFNWQVNYGDGGTGSLFPPQPGFPQPNPFPGQPTQPGQPVQPGLPDPTLQPGVEPTMPPPPINPGPTTPTTPVQPPG